MTPFGDKLRAMREERNIPQKQMAASLGISAAYLSALEHGHRGKPTWALLQRIIGYFNIIWDEAEELQNLAAISHPKAVIDTAGLHPDATKLANLLADHIHQLEKDDVVKLIDQINEAIEKETRDPLKQTS